MEEEEQRLNSDTDEANQAPKRRGEHQLGRGGWRREGDKERGFKYLNSKGKLVRSEAHLNRITGLRIPPAWTDVRISPSFTSDLQATGFDSAGRKQYIYHPDFVARQSERKFNRLALFARNLPRMREITSEHLETYTNPMEPRVMATLVRLINEAYFRAGSDEYVKRYRTYGITTLLKRHVRLVERGVMLFQYTGKRGIRQRQVVTDEQLFAVIESLMNLPGRRVFQFYDEQGNLHVASGHILNRYIREVMAPGLSAKDFRTWAGTLLAAETLADLGPAGSEREAKRNMTETVKMVAEQLGNTPAVTRSSYISPIVFERYQEGKTLEGYVRGSVKTIQARQLDYDPEELALVRLLGLRVPLINPQVE